VLTVRARLQNISDDELLGFGKQLAFAIRSRMTATASRLYPRSRSSSTKRGRSGENVILSSREGV
jgi:hypothetical protein